MFERVDAYFHAWASALFVQLYRAMREPQNVGRQQVGYPRFLFSRDPSAFHDLPLRRETFGYWTSVYNGLR